MSQHSEISKSLEDTKRIAEKFLHTCEVLKDHACVVGLSGNLGSGKTTFTQAIAKLLGIEDTVTSPTFVIEKIYTLENTENKGSVNNGFDFLIHIDAYRLEKAEELQRLGWQEIISDPKNIIFLEWPEKVALILPHHTKKVNFKFINNTTREIIF